MKGKLLNLVCAECAEGNERMKFTVKAMCDNCNKEALCGNPKEFGYVMMWFPPRKRN